MMYSQQMEQSVNISISKLCGENFMDFERTVKSGYCTNCRKEVIDFSAMSDRELFAFFTNNAEKVCGRFKPEQLGTIVAPKQVSRHRMSWLAAGMGLFPLFFANEVLADIKYEPESTVQLPGYQTAHQSKFSSGDTTYIIKGKLIDSEDSSTLPGANILLKDSKTGVQTGADGSFLLTLKDPPSSSVTLVFSYLGYSSKELEVHLSRPAIDLGEIKMNLDIIMLGEVVCVHSWSPRGIWHRITHLFRR